MVMIVSFSRTSRWTMFKASMILVIFSSCTTAKEFSSIDLAPGIIHSIDSLCLLQMDKGHFPGLAIAIADRENRIWSKGYGHANIESNRPVDPNDDLFRIGSISKAVTAAALARLAERRTLNLDQPISDYYKSGPVDKRTITLRQLGGHKAGIRHYRGIEFLSNIHYTNIEDALQVFIHDTLLFQPGMNYSYSTYGWTLISKVMEDAANQPFPEIIKKEVQIPLKLSDLKPDIVDSVNFHRVHFYEFQNDHFVASPTVDLSNKWAGGGLLCSAADLAKFGYALTGPGYLQAESLEEFTTSQTLPDGKKTNYGIGFRIGINDVGLTWYGHSGGSIGGTSMLLIFPEIDLVIVTLVNRSEAPMDNLAMKIGTIVSRGLKNQ